MGGGPSNHRRRRRHHTNDSSFSQFLLHRILVQVCVRAFICIIHTYSLHHHLPLLPNKQCPPPCPCRNREHARMSHRLDLPFLKKIFVFFDWGEAWEEALAVFERSPVERSVERSSTYMKPVRLEFLHLILNRLENFDQNLSRCVFRYVAPYDNDTSLRNDEPVWNVQGPPFVFDNIIQIEVFFIMQLVLTSDVVLHDCFTAESYICQRNLWLSVQHDQRQVHQWLI